MVLDQPPVGAPEDTSPIPSTSQPGTFEFNTEPPTIRKSRRRWLRIVLLYLVVMLAVTTLAFLRGRSINQTHNQEQLSLFLQEQFELGIQNLQTSQYELARQRFEAIIRYDPEYPDAEEKLIEAYVAARKPIIASTPRPTLTPDPSPPEDLFNQAKDALANGDWTTVINKLLTLRAKDPTYRPIDSDGMMYIALRNRGMDLIGQGLMEEGLYDLSLAERFGPLDRDATFRRSLAEQYLLANSYIGLNWGKAAELFSTLCQQVATIDSCFKYAEAAWQYGDLLWDIEDPCGAQGQYEGSLLASENETLVPTATKAAVACETATAQPTLQLTAVPTTEETSTQESPTLESPTPTQTPTSTPE